MSTKKDLPELEDEWINHLHKKVDDDPEGERLLKLYTRMVELNQRTNRLKKPRPRYRLKEE